MAKVLRLEVMRKSASTDLTLAWPDLKSSPPTKALQGHASSSVLECSQGPWRRAQPSQMLARWRAAWRVTPPDPAGRCAVGSQRVTEAWTSSQKPPPPPQHSDSVQPAGNRSRGCPCGPAPAGLRALR